MEGKMNKIYENEKKIIFPLRTKIKI